MFFHHGHIKYLLLYSILLFLTLSHPELIKAQHQERQIIIYNVTFGALTGGIGAAINKPAAVNWKKAFLKGCWQGSIGGLLTYSGKKSLYFINKNKTLAYAWPAKIIHAAGTSIIEKAAAYEPFLESWNINIGPARFDFTLGKNRELKVRFLPVSLYSIIDGSLHGDFDLSTSLQTGNLVYKNENAFYASGSYTSGVSLGRAIVYQNSSDRYYIISHELVHQFQFDEYQVTNVFLKPFESKVNSQTLRTIFSKYIYFDIPYHWMVYYGVEGTHGDPHYYRNFFEFEAERLSTNAYVPK